MSSPRGGGLPLDGMNTTSATTTTRERKLLAAARTGDEGAFRELVQPHRRDLHALCYRMLGSSHDADDALQDALLRAWRGLDRFGDRGSFRGWLHRIATNVCLDAIRRRPKRTLPIAHGQAAGPGNELGEAVTEPIWIEPYADDELVGLETGETSPEARYERRESVELAFIVALQRLPGTQRAALILRDVLGFSGRETAQALGTTVASANGALRRARKATAATIPAESQRANMRRLGDERLRRLVERYTDAWERGDVAAIVAMLAEDATFSMPPLPTWYRGRAAIAGFLTRFAIQERWRLVPARANSQLAFGCYAWDDAADAFTALSLDVLTLDGSLVGAVTSFVAPYTQGPARERFALDVFDRLGLPGRLG
jgi:RNA polymerase sigma-70 factor (ECF subfamily)